jgi:hypothetical protein
MDGAHNLNDKVIRLHDKSIVIDFIRDEIAQRMGLPGRGPAERYYDEILLREFHDVLLIHIREIFEYQLEINNSI